MIFIKMHVMFPQYFKEANLSLNIVYQDQSIVVVHKPPGLLVHRSAIDKYETEFLVQQLRDQIEQQVFVVHRLDKPTSGLMVLGLDKARARALSTSFAERKTYKEYMAIVRGYATDQIIDYALKEKLDKMTDSKVDPNKAAQDAVSSLVLLAKKEIEKPVGRYATARFSAVKLIPKTGRKHQLRRHMAHISHPILGDTTHGDGKQNKFAREHLQVNRLALVATKLCVPHPVSNELMSFTTQVDDDLKPVFSMFENSFPVSNN
jgi:tRNA pseudouridine65 synthase